MKQRFTFLLFIVLFGTSLFAAAQEGASADTYLAKGLEHYEAGRYKEALQSYQEGVRLAPKNVNIHYNLGRAYYALGQWNQAIDAYQETLRLKPDSSNAHVSLGMTYHQQGRFGEAVKSYKKAVQIKPDMAEAYWNIGLSHHFAKQYSEAIAAYGEYARLKPSAANEFQYQFNRGDAFRSIGQNAAAVEAFKLAVALKQDNADSNFGLGMAHLANRQFAEGVKALTRATVIKPGTISYELELGRAYIGVGNRKAALQQHTKLKSLNKDAANELLRDIDGR